LRSARLLGFATALERAGADGGTTRFDPVSLETLVDSPLIAGRNFKRIDLSPSGAPPVYLDIVADRPENLAHPGATATTPGPGQRSRRGCSERSTTGTTIFS